MAISGSAADAMFGMLRAVFGPAFLAAAAGTGPLSSQPTGPRGLPDDASAPPSADPDAAGPGRVAASLSATETGAFEEIARTLSGGLVRSGADPRGDGPGAEIVPLQARPRPSEAARILDRLPMPVAVLRDGTPVFANAALLEAVGRRDLASWLEEDGLASAGGTALLRSRGPGNPDAGCLGRGGGRTPRVSGRVD